MSSSPERDLQVQTGTEQKPKKWTRICGRKVKTGCRTCKKVLPFLPIRRIKCDEQKPECFRCQISGRKCDGYARAESSLRVPKGSGERRRSSSTGRSANASPISPASPTLTVPIHTDITGAENERRAFHHFRVKTADDLSGCFPSNFWSRLVLQLSHSEPAVKHALMAVATAHENYQNGTAETDLAALDLQQYHKAMACLNQQLSIPTKHSAEVALICCALFICFEGLRGDYEAALIHLQSGIDIIQSWTTLGERTSSSEVPYLDPKTDEDELIELFTRLDFSASAFVPGRPPQMIPRPPGKESVFRNLSDARRSLERLVNRTIFFMIQTYGVNSQPSPEQNILLAAVSAWSVQFDNLLKSAQMTNLSGKDLLGAFTLIMHKKTISVMLQTCHSYDPSIVNQFSEDIESIVSISAFVASPATNEPVESRPTFTSDMGIIAPLHYVLMSSQDPSIREKAIRILVETPRREGIWDSKLIAKIAERSMQESKLEEDLVMSRDDTPDISNFLEGYEISEAM